MSWPGFSGVPPDLITHLVLSATSGGMRMDELGAQDWRPATRTTHPGLPDWFAGYREDLTPTLSALRIPTLLLWGDAATHRPAPVGRACRVQLLTGSPQVQGH